MQTPKERKDDNFSIIENDFDGYKFGDKFGKIYMKYIDLLCMHK